MDEDTVRRLALVLAVQAEIEGLKAHNEIYKGPSNKYGQDKFDAKAEELRNLAYAHREQL